MRHLAKHIIAGFLVLFWFGPGMSVSEEKPESFELTIDAIMAGPELVGTEPDVAGWSRDSRFLYFQWKKPGEKNSEWYKLSPLEKTPVEIKTEDIIMNPPVAPRTSGRYRNGGLDGMDMAFNAKRTHVLLTRGGNISLLNLETGKERQLLLTDVRESGAEFSHDQKKAVFRSGDNLYYISLIYGTLTQLTSFTRETRPESPRSDEIDKWYQAQQRELFEEFKQGRGNGFPGRRSFGMDSGNQQRRIPHQLKENEWVAGLELSPDEEYVLFTLYQPLEGIRETIVPYFVTRSGYTESRESHTKAAVDSSRIRAGSMSVKTGKIAWIEYGQGDRDLDPSGIYWSPDGNAAVLEVRSSDRKDAWLMKLDPETGKTEVIEQVHDDAWVGWLGLTNILWDPDSSAVYYISEKNGFAQLYRNPINGSPAKSLTPPGFEVTAADLSQNGKKWYLTTSEVHPGEQHFYTMPLKGGRRKRITNGSGHNESFLSPDEKWIAVLHSSATHPAELFLLANRPEAEMIPVTESTSEAFRSVDWAQPEVFTFKARDGFDVYARKYKPAVWHENKPGVIFIHGAGYLQNAHKGWSSYYREYMFHNILLKQGYMILDVDYRGSAGYGRDCRTAIYRHMGGKDLDDIVDAAEYMVRELGANPEAIGIYGGSYGGFLTLMGMFTEPDIFAAGAALRPVTDWAHYHPGYTVDILNRPQEDEEAYRQSSPIYFAEGLKGALLICHGMVDTNVHFQDTARLVQRLVELRKENWEAAIYPVEGHAFHNASSWADEYKRIFRLFEKNLK